MNEVAGFQLEDGRDPIDDLDGAIRINLRDVTTMDPRVLDELFGCLPIVEVTRHDRRSLEAHFTSWRDRSDCVIHLWNISQSDLNAL